MFECIILNKIKIYVGVVILIKMILYSNNNYEIQGTIVMFMKNI